MTQLVSDDFNRANGGLGANWTTTPSLVAPAINSNEVRCPVGTPASAYDNTATWPNDQYAEITVGSVVSTVSDEGVGPAVRIATSDGARYFAQTNTTETKLYKWTSAGGFVQLGVDGAACTTGDLLRTTANGTSISVSKNGTTIIGPVTDSTLASGKAGIWCTDAGGQGTINAWAGGDLAVAGVAATGTELELRLNRPRPGRGPYSLGKYYRPIGEMSIPAKTYILSPSGLITFSGAVAELRTRVQVPTGLITYSGSTAQLRTRVQIPSGTITFAGGPDQVHTRVQVPSGQIVFSGSAALSFTPGATTYTISPSGSIVYSGSAAEIRTRVQAPAGLLSFSGVASQIRTRSSVPTGQIVYSGTAPIQFSTAGGPNDLPNRRTTGHGT